MFAPQQEQHQERQRYQGKGHEPEQIPQVDAGQGKVAAHAIDTPEIVGHPELPECAGVFASRQSFDIHLGRSQYQRPHQQRHHQP